ncbi:unnamed protein product [Cuscuta campestris]|uniref:Uncharacterized protein n=1 Tax=Cuscuta campestris TaxID=132261 RepID=A0A484M2K2_9ASTE|nr:unnamed protein product [Cuscuta campestris]
MVYSPAKERSAVRALRRKSFRQEVGRRVPQRVCGGARWLADKEKKKGLPLEGRSEVVWSLDEGRFIGIPPSPTPDE